MSKSEGNFLTIDKLIEQGYSPMIYKFFCLQSHYRKPLLYSVEGMNSAKSAYNKLAKRISEIENEGVLDKTIFEEYNNNFKNALSNDLNSSMALTILFDVLKANTNGKTKRELIKNFDSVLNLNLLNAYVESENKNMLSEKEVSEIQKLIDERTDAKLNKNYARADEIRNQLAKRGIELIDTKDGTKFTLKK